MNKIITILLSVLIATSTLAQENNNNSKDKYIESELVSLADKSGVSWKTKQGDFMFKPYVLVQTRGIFNYYDDEGLSLAEQDNILNSGFGIPYALVGFAGRAFDKITYNIAFNAAGNGAAMLNQAWFDINVKESLRFRVGKFKTPFTNAYLSRLGQTMFPTPVSSLITAVNIPFSINSVNPTIATGFDIGVQAHGLINNTIEYRAGIFNGTGIGVNKPTNTTSDESGVPSLLYAGRLAYMPFGKMPLHQGDPSDLNSTKFMLAASGSYNVEANNETSNDTRAGFELSFMKNRFFFSAEAYLLNIDFVERLSSYNSYSFVGGYAQAGYFMTDKIQPVVRFDYFDRNSTKTDGFLYMPSVGLNYYLIGQNLKLQTYYQYLGKSGHEDQFAENDDDNGMAEHKFCVQLQFVF